MGRVSEALEEYKQRKGIIKNSSLPSELKDAFVDMITEEYDSSIDII